MSALPLKAPTFVIKQGQNIASEARIAKLLPGFTSAKPAPASCISAKARQGV
ncbi:MAG: hypothetical protein ABTQ25_02465 [Nitrosomonas ureae]